MDHEAIPEHAISSFERVHGLRVTVHDVVGSLWPYLNSDRFHHTQALCRAVKSWGGERACTNFDAGQIREELLRHREGIVKICHAGLLEWVVPAFGEEKLEWVLFAGLQRPGPDIQTAIRDRPRQLPQSFWDDGATLPPPSAEVDGELILEGLRQLMARLKLWAQDSSRGAEPGLTISVPEELATRALQVHRYISSHHTDAIRMSDLAHLLGISESRASHVVRECCGATFRDLLQQARLKTAMGLLRHSQLSILETALHSGFEDVRQFHRVFRREAGTTPNQYRKTARS